MQKPLYHIIKDGRYLTANMQKGQYEFTANREFRYTFHEERARELVKFFPGATVEKEITEMGHCALCMSLIYPDDPCIIVDGAMFCSDSCYEEATGA